MDKGHRGERVDLAVEGELPPASHDHHQDLHLVVPMGLDAVPQAEPDQVGLEVLSIQPPQGAWPVPRRREAGQVNRRISVAHPTMFASHTRRLNRRRYHHPMVDGAARRAGWLAWLVVLMMLVTACERSVEPGADQPQPATTTAAEAAPAGLRVQEYPVPAGSRPHDVAPAADGRSVWYTAQGSGQLGLLDPATGESRLIPLGDGSAPHGVIVGPDGAPWVTDGGLNAIVRVDPSTEKAERYPLPAEGGSANLNTAAFRGGVLWFTGQAGVLGRLDPKVGRVEVFDAPRGPGPYGITTTPDGQVFYASLAGSHIGRIDHRTGAADVLEPPTGDQGARRVWSDSRGRIWVSEWNAGQLGRYDPRDGGWREWKLPGANPMAYAVYVDDNDHPWLSDFAANALVRFDPSTERFTVVPLPSSPANVRQLLGRPGEVWGAESGVDKLVVVRTG
jgi:virginiamycin B lyase